MGPTVAVWLKPHRQAPTSGELLKIARRLDPGAISSKDFSIGDMSLLGGVANAMNDPRPFGMNVGDTGFSNEELAPAVAALGFMPSIAIHAYAYSNRRVDHQMLAELAIFLARHFEGVIDFGGSLGAVRAQHGWLWAIPYIDSEVGGTYHVADVAFLESWVRHPNFHMVK